LPGPSTSRSCSSAPVAVYLHTYLIEDGEGMRRDDGDGVELVFYRGSGRTLLFFVPGLVWVVCRVFALYLFV
jgi:hypothetical protein